MSFLPQEGPLSESGLTSMATDASFMITQEVEQKFSEYRPKNEKDDTKLVLNASLESLPRDGKENLSHDLLACKTDDELHQHALSLVQGLSFP